MRCASLLLVAAPAGQIGDSDCEELGSGALVQPINALTSLAYTVVGLVVIVIAWRRRGRVDLPTLVFGLALAAVGLGSVAFHGPQPGGSRLMHDLPILLTATFMLVHDATLIAGRGSRTMWWWFGASVVVATALSVANPELGVAATGVALLAFAGCEVVVYRRRLRGDDIDAQRRIVVTIVAVAGVAGATWLLGRTDSPACDPDGYLQFHAVWHLLSALVFGLWWWLALGRTPNGDPRSGARPKSDGVSARAGG